MRFLLACLMIICFHPSNAQHFDTIHIYYETAHYQLKETHKRLLDSLTKISDLKKIMIYAYTDRTGSEKNNHDLSLKRAQEVMRYLVEQNMPGNLIPICEGMGEEYRNSKVKSNEEDRRTDIFVLRTNKQVDNSIETTVKAESFATGRFEEMKINQLLRLDNITFYPGSANVLPQSEIGLLQLLKVMDGNPQLEIKLEGHVCCCSAPDGYEKSSPSWILSEQRAQAVFDYLTDNGIDKNRLSFEGFGRTLPVFEKEHTPEEQSANRRVEVRIIHE